MLIHFFYLLARFNQRSVTAHNQTKHHDEKSRSNEQPFNFNDIVEFSSTFVCIKTVAGVLHRLQRSIDTIDPC